MAKKAAAKAVDQAQPAPAAVQLKSVEDLDAALKEWGELNAKEKTLKQAAQLQVNSLLSKCQQSMVVVVDGQTVTIESRRKALEAGIQTYGEAHQAELLDGLEIKSRKLTHGTIQYRGQPEKLVDTEAAKADSTASQFITSLMAVCRIALKKVKLALFPDLTCTEVVTVSVEWNHTLLFEKYKSGEITLKQLKAAGFDIAGGEKAGDKFSAKPNEVLVKSEATSNAETSEKP